MSNTLIGCGGTGAHVALAFIRLHALGELLGFFRNMELPTFYLVDQDYGDGPHDARPTAWQALDQVLERHPSRVMWGDRPGQRRRPAAIPVSPLPVGRDQNFLDDGMVDPRGAVPQFRLPQPSSVGGTAPDRVFKGYDGLARRWFSLVQVEEPRRRNRERQQLGQGIQSATSRDREHRCGGVRCRGDGGRRGSDLGATPRGRERGPHCNGGDAPELVQVRRDRRPPR